MAQKCVAKSSPFGSAFDETGNIDDIEMSFLDRHRSEIWYQGREWIVSDFSFGIWDIIDNAGFANTRRPDQCDVCKQLEFKYNFFFVAWFSE